MNNSRSKFIEVYLLPWRWLGFVGLHHHSVSMHVRCSKNTGTMRWYQNELLAGSKFNVLLCHHHSGRLSLCQRKTQYHVMLTCMHTQCVHIYM